MTGYTARIQPATTVGEWLKICAHAFFYDLDFDKPLPQGKDLSDEINDVLKCKARVEQLSKCTLADARVRSKAEYDASVKEIKAYEAEKAATLATFQALLADVRRWDAPKIHEGLKKFASEQLESEIKYLEFVREPPTKLAPKEWLANQQRWARESLDRAEQYLAEKREGDRKLKEWVKKLEAELARLR